MNAVSDIVAVSPLRGADLLSVTQRTATRTPSHAVPRCASLPIRCRLDFWLWLFHFGVCVWKSGFLPRFLGVLLIAACFGYLAVCLAPFLLPSYVNVVGRLANIPLTLGEPAAILWLLIMGAKDQRLEIPA
jgi:hypothetical protein